MVKNENAAAEQSNSEIVLSLEVENDIQSEGDGGEGGGGDAGGGGDGSSSPNTGATMLHNEDRNQQKNLTENGIENMIVTDQEVQIGAKRKLRNNDEISTVEPCESKKLKTDDEASKTVSKFRTAKKKINRCSLCGKKVGLLGFTCRCGGLFCGFHRYSDKHNCTFDYRLHGAEEIRRNNPVVICEKIRKI